MKKIIAIILSFVLIFSCSITCFAAEPLDSKDKVVEFKIDNPFGDQMTVDFGFNKFYDETSDILDFLPAIEINEFTTEDIIFWLHDELSDIATQMTHLLLNAMYGTEYRTDNDSGVTVTFDKARFGDRTDEIYLRANKLDEHYSGREYPYFVLYRTNDSEAVKYCYTVELLNADGTLAEPEEGMEYHQIRVIFELPDDAPLGLYEIHHDFVGTNSGSYDFAFNYNGQLSYTFSEWVEWGAEE